MDKKQKDQLAKHLMEEGWKAREEWDFERAEVLLNEAQDIFEDLEDWFNVTECLNHVAYSYKIQATLNSDCGLSAALDSYDIAEEKGTKKVLILRALMSLASECGNYELALKYADEFLDLMERPTARADGLRMKAQYQLRTGDLSGAEKTLKEAEKLFETNKKDEREPHKSIWEVSMLLTKALVSYNKGENKEAEELGKKALDMAKEKNLETRIVEAENFLELTD